MSRASPTGRSHTKQLQEELKETRDSQLAELERIAGMTVNEAKAHLLERSEELDPARARPPRPPG